MDSKELAPQRPRDRAKSAFDARANSPFAWGQSEQLLIAGFAAVQRGVELHTETQMHGVVIVQAMLLGLAIECDLKGKWVHDGNKLADENGRLLLIPNSGRHHELAQLADAVRFELSFAERAVLQRPSLFVRWAGRYPVPTNWEQMIRIKAPTGKDVSPSFISKTELSTAEKVFWSLAKQVPLFPATETTGTRS